MWVCGCLSVGVCVCLWVWVWSGCVGSDACSLLVGEVAEVLEEGLPGRCGLLLSLAGHISLLVVPSEHVAPRRGVRLDELQVVGLDELPLYLARGASVSIEGGLEGLGLLVELPAPDVDVDGGLQGVELLEFDLLDGAVDLTGRPGNIEYGLVRQVAPVVAPEQERRRVEDADPVRGVLEGLKGQEELLLPE